MEAKKELPKFIFKFPLSGDKEKEEETKNLLKQIFGNSSLIIFADKFDIYQLEDIYKKII